MTCIVGLVDGGEVWMGGDSCASCNDITRAVLQPKVARVGDFLFGCAGTSRTLQIMRYLFAPPAIGPGRDVMGYMICDFMPALRACFKEHGGIEIFNGMENLDGNILIGFQGRLFGIYQGFQVDEYRDLFHVIGSGLQPANGALMATESCGLHPEVRVRKALEASAAFVTTVQGPFHIQKL